MSAPYEDFSKASSLGFGPQGSAATAAGGVPFWGDNPNAWDKCVLAGVELPGIANVEPTVEAKVDHKAIPGTHGAKLTYLGYEPAKVKISLTLWTPEQLQAYQELVPLIRPREKILPVDIAHPSCALHGITSVKVLKIEGPKRNGSGDFCTIELSAIENWTAQRSNQAKVDSSANALDKFNNVITPKADQKVGAKPSTQNASFSPPNASFPP